ncbi:MAG: hypothetical protein R2853_20475 [Thermomicrobiales bacterium]
MRRSTPRYEIIYSPHADAPPVVMSVATDANDATVLFADGLQRLLNDRAGGSLAIHRKASTKARPDVILRQELTATSTLAVPAPGR